MGIRFLAINQLFLANRTEMFYENSRNYYLSIGGPKNGRGPKNWRGPKMGVAPSPPIWVGGLKTQPISWPTWWTIWVPGTPLYLEILFQIFWEPTPPQGSEHELVNMYIKSMYYYYHYYEINKSSQMWAHYYNYYYYHHKIETYLAQFVRHCHQVQDVPPNPLLMGWLCQE